MVASYDKIPYNDQILLDLPFYEGDGTITHDQAMPHHEDVELKNLPEWDRTQYGIGPFGWGFDTGYDHDDIGAFDLAFYWGFHSGEGLGVITFDGVFDYLELDKAACVDLNFMSGDYSIGIWLKWELAGGVASHIVIARYEVSVSGWELYLTETGLHRYLTLRHHHAGGASVRTAYTSDDWTEDTWWFCGVTRIGDASFHYRNGVLIPIATYNDLIDPETCNQDLVIGVRYTKNADYYKGSLWRPRVWPRALSADEWLDMFEAERGFFGV